VTTEDAPTEAGLQTLATTLAASREMLSALRYPLALAAAGEAERTAQAVVAQIDNYLLPRLGRLDAPLVAVVAGSSGAGKSTLVNSLLRRSVTPSGALRPTTRTPVLVCHPKDLPWFAEPGILPGLVRVSDPNSSAGALRLVPSPGLTRGAALLDTPDVDSVVPDNRALSSHLLAATDLLIFVTTAARYADAASWTLLLQAKNRGTAIAMVLDRVPPAAGAEVTAHLTVMLAERGLAEVPLFVLPESELDGQGLLAEDVVAGLREWFTGLAGSGVTRSAVVRRAVGGTTDTIETAVTALAAAADEQVAGAWALSSTVRSATRAARGRVERAIADGAVLQGEVSARWREFARSSDVVSPLHGPIMRIGDRLAATLSRAATTSDRFQETLNDATVALIHGALAEAAEQCVAGWRVHPAGPALLASAESPPASMPASQVATVVRDWRWAVADLVRAERDRAAPVGRRGPADVDVLVMLVAALVFTATSEGGTAGNGTSIARRVLETVLEPTAVAGIVDKARTDLMTRVSVLLTAECAKYQDIVDNALVDETIGDRLREVANRIMIARLSAGLPAARSTPVPLAATPDSPPPEPTIDLDHRPEG
jgi:hypothetical protein